MKKNTINLLFVSLVLNLFISCSNNSNDITDEIVGQWEYLRSTRDGVITQESPFLLQNTFTMFNDQGLVYDANIIHSNGDCEQRTYDVGSIWIRKEDNQGVYYSLRGESSAGGQFNYTFSHISSDGLLIVGVREDGVTASGNRVDYYQRAE